MNTSEVLLDTLSKLGASTVFFVSGGNAMYLNDALQRSSLKSVAVHHEQAAAMAAESFGRVSESFGVCMTTNGPAVSNLITGLAGAFLDSVPLIAIVGQSKDHLPLEDRTEFLRQSGLFELNTEGLVSSVSKAFIRVSEGVSAREAAIRAVHLATSGRPGPVVIEVPLDMQSKSEDVPAGDPEIPNVHIEETDVVKWADVEIALKESKKILLLAGNGVLASRSNHSFRALVEEFKIPFVTTQLAKGVAEFAHPQFVGHVGPRGDRAGNTAVQSAEMLITIGASLGNQTTGYELSLFGPKCKKFVQDKAGGVSGKKLALSHVTYIDESAPLFLENLRSCIDKVGVPKLEQDWLLKLADLKKHASVHGEPHLRNGSGHNLYDFAEELSGALSKLNRPSRVVTDAGLCFYVMGQAFRLSARQTYTVSGGLGSMGYALPAVVGQSCVDEESLVVGVSGDGSTQMNVQELGTLSALKGHVVFFLINNQGYASIRNTQDSFFGRRIGSSSETGVEMPSWELLAQAYGLNYRKIEANASLQDELESALEGSKPLLVEVMCQPSQALMPYVANYTDEAGGLRSKALDHMEPSSHPSPTELVIN